MSATNLDAAKLRPQTYGIACAQTVFGGPKGIWLECKGCARSDVIAGSRFKDEDPYANISNADAAYIFRKHGWSGEGDNMLNQHCPACNASGTEAGTVKTAGLGPKDDGPVLKVDAERME